MDGPKARYGQEVVYFSVLNAGNYNYIMEWTFRDDGMIVARAGSTGPQNGPNYGKGHMHDFTWRLDVDLNGSANSVYLTKHIENFVTPSTATDQSELISVEGSRVWIPEQFNTLEVFSTLRNGNNRLTSYELVPSRSGNSRHSEPFTKADFWVTRYNGNELLAKDLPTYIANHESTVNADIVLWYTTSFHHENNEPDEDGTPAAGGTVPVHFVGFELQPKNLFNGTPFYP